VQPMLYQLTDEGVAGVAIMAVDAIDGGQRFTVNRAIDLRHIDVREADGHAGAPLPTLAANFFLQAAFARQDCKG